MSALQHLCSDPKIIQSAVCTGTDHNLVDGNRFLDFIDGLCVFRKMRECDRRTQCRKVNCVFLIINSIRIRFINVVWLCGMLLHVCDRLVVYRENAVLAACLNRHVGNCKPVVHA